MDLSAATLGADADRAGFLVKQGKVVKNWKKRWFLLKQSQLFYYKSPKDKQPIKIITLLHDSQVESERADTPTFSIVTKDRKWYIQCENSSDRDAWMEDIRNNIKKLSAGGGGSSGGAEPTAAASAGGASDMPPLPAGLSEAQVKFRARAVFNFEPTHHDEIALTDGLQLFVLEVREDGWWRVVDENGNKGLCPGNHNERI